MIGKVTRGDDTGGLLRYLFGPGRSNEHSSPRVVADWQPGAPSGGQGLQNREAVRDLARLLDHPLAALQRRPVRPVWHCSLRAAPGDRRLTDQEWACIARAVLHEVGLARRGDDEGCRWVAVRHAEDHIHLVVTLARQDGRMARLSNDYYRVGTACLAAEARYGLVATPARDRTAPKRPSRAELGRHRGGAPREVPRSRMHREVRAAAASATDVETFLALLRERGMLVRLRTDEGSPGEATGYAVAWPGDRARGGHPVWFGGGKLAADLTLPKLRASWEAHAVEPGREEGAPSPTQLARAGPHAVLGSGVTSQTMLRASHALSGVTSGLLAAPPSSRVLADDAAGAVADLLVVLARCVEGTGSGRLTAASAAAVRAGAVPYARTGVASLAGHQLRALARTLATAGRVHPSSSSLPEVLEACARLLEAVAAVRGQGHDGTLAASAAAAVISATTLVPSGGTEGRRQPHPASRAGHLAQPALGPVAPSAGELSSSRGGRRSRVTR